MILGLRVWEPRSERGARGSFLYPRLRPARGEDGVEDIPRQTGADAGRAAVIRDAAVFEQPQGNGRPVRECEAQMRLRKVLVKDIPVFTAGAPGSRGTSGRERKSLNLVVRQGKRAVVGVIVLPRLVRQEGDALPAALQVQAGFKRIRPVFSVTPPRQS